MKVRMTLMALCAAACMAAPDVSYARPSGGDAARYRHLLSVKRIYFGHQSVGRNLLEGIAEVLPEYPGLTLLVREGRDPAVFSRPAFAHSAIGANGDPIAKCDDFRRVIEGGLGRRANLAFFKLCYVDITAKTDIEGLFRHYTRTMEALAGKYPRVKFLHCTVPLRAPAPGRLAALRRAMGVPAPGDRDNIARNRFNELLRKRYGASGTLIDLARWEASPEGGAASFRAGGSSYDCLAPAYTSDGGHLNEQGRKAVARRFLDFLQEAVR